MTTQETDQSCSVLGSGRFVELLSCARKLNTKKSGRFTEVSVWCWNLTVYIYIYIYIYDAPFVFVVISREYLDIIN